MDDTISKIAQELEKGRAVLLGAVNDSGYMLEKICEKAAAVGAVRFEGRKKGVYYHSEYTSPCNSFKEIKKLILSTNSVKGLRKEFSGIVMIDISEWLNHESENYFSILLKFLYDKNACWKYVFTINSDDKRKKERMLHEIIKIFRCAVIDYEMRGGFIAKEMIERVSSREGITLDKRAAAELIWCCEENNLGEHIIENLMMDIICEIREPNISEDDVRNYFNNTSCAYSRLINFESKREGSLIHG